MFAQRFVQKFEELTAQDPYKVKFNAHIRILQPSNYNGKPLLLHYTAQKSKCPRRFLELDPQIMHTCLMCPCRASYEWVLFLFLFFRQKCGVC